MIRSIRIALATGAAMAVAVAAAVPATAAAPGPKGTLTAVEYQQLINEQVAYNKLKHKKNLTWNDFYAVCHDVGQSTRLTQSIRANCETGVGIDQSLVGFYSDLDRCSALSTNTTTTTTPTSTTTTGTTTTGTGTTTTGTTTTGTTTTATGTTTTGAGQLSPADLKLLACMQPEYAVISRAVKSIYNSQVALRKQVVARKFVGRCELTLAPTTAQLHDLAIWVKSAKQLAADVTLISEVSNGSQPASAINGPQVNADALAFDAAAKAFEKVKRPQKLSVCPHES
jgi:hypothetical protein